uniref:Dynein heavy chain 1, axonemal n=1 Tax=Lygus hesperus TaxID=30085 RepID=A0A0A9YIV3_LYGHE
MLRQAAFKQRPLLFIVSDTQIVFESMLEDINNLLNAGEVPNLFVEQEFDEVLNTIRPTCVQEGVPLDKVNIYARFVRACRLQLHIALCMSPLGEPFRNRLRMFPALVNCCTIDWFEA